MGFIASRLQSRRIRARIARARARLNFRPSLLLLNLLAALMLSAGTGCTNIEKFGGDEDGSGNGAAPQPCACDWWEDDSNCGCDDDWGDRGWGDDWDDDWGGGGRDRDPDVMPDPPGWGGPGGEGCETDADCRAGEVCHPDCRCLPVIEDCSADCLGGDLNDAEPEFVGVLEGDPLFGQIAFSLTFYDDLVIGTVMLNAHQGELIEFTVAGTPVDGVVRGRLVLLDWWQDGPAPALRFEIEIIDGSHIRGELSLDDDRRMTFSASRTSDCVCEPGGDDDPGDDSSDNPGDGSSDGPGDDNSDNPGDGSGDDNPGDGSGDDPGGDNPGDDNPGDGGDHGGGNSGGDNPSDDGPECLFSADCAQGEVCIDATCARTCDEDSDCGEGAYCEDWLCVEDCEDP